MQTLTTAEAVERARELAAAPGRTILGLAGSPGAGKSHLAQAIEDAVEGSVVVGMDGFHLAHQVLTARGDVAAKGAPQTFDADGYVALLQRIRHQGDETVWAPRFDRHLEDPIAGSVAVRPSHCLVVTEGNYLLLDQAPWNQVPPLCDEVWFVDPGEPLRLERLIGRHVHHGRTPDEAAARATSGTDGRNAVLVAGTRRRAGLVVSG